MDFVTIAVLSLVLAFNEAPYRWLRDPAFVIAAVAVATLLPALCAWVLNRAALSKLEHHVEDPGIGQSFFGTWYGRLQSLISALHAALLGLTDWLRLCNQLPVIGEWPGLPGMIASLPLILSIILIWIVTYPSDRALRQIALEINLHRGRPVHPVWSLPQFVMYSLRHQVLFIVIPMACILVVRDLITRNDDWLRAFVGHRQAPDLALGAAAAVIAIIAPVMLRYVWVTQPLPESPLRRRLLDMCAKLKLKCREILVWRSGGMIVNAAVVGVVPPLRYVMITDGMLEQMDDTKIEAVFGHETGHIKRHHILYFLLYAFITGCMLTIVGNWTRSVDRRTFEWVVAGLGVLMVCKWWLLFGWISRHFERQADLFGVRTLALAGIPCDRECAMHRDGIDAQSIGTGPRDRVCQTAAHVFSDTLNEVAVLNGIPPEVHTWRHGSISGRSRHVQMLASDPAAAERFENKVERIKLAILLTAIFMAVWAVVELKLWKIVVKWWA
ncbi:MAG: M48 family metallopeptidase [Phycisphaerae bacterium]